MKQLHNYLDRGAPEAGVETAEVVVTDGELLMQFVRHRYEAAFAEIVSRHGGMVWVVCREVLGHHQDVEDAFQATFLALAQRADRIRNCDSAAACLYKVAQRTAQAARRRQSQRREEELPIEPPQGDDATPLLYDRHLVHVMLEELRDLPARYQLPLVLRYLEGHSRRTIAEQTDSTVPQIQGRLVRGRRLLRSRMARRGTSLTLSVDAMTDLAADANAAQPITLATATTENCLALKVTGTATGASTVALELAKQGMKAMWLASAIQADFTILKRGGPWAGWGLVPNGVEVWGLGPYGSGRGWTSRSHCPRYSIRSNRAAAQ